MDDLEARVTSCESENMALQTLLVGLLNCLVKSNAQALAEGAFVYADLMLEAATIQIGKEGYPPDVQSPLEILEQLRTMTFGPQKGPND